MDATAVRNAVERIAASDSFRNSDRLCRFLRYTVDAHLAGDAGQIKEYLIGREVFDRDSEYDPRTDPIVRVEARRLRKKLEEYYAGPGREEPLRIAFPKGSYAPQVTASPADASPPVARISRRTFYAGAGFAAAAVGAVLLWRVVPGAPKLVVLPARWVWRTDQFTQTPLDEDVAERVAAELANRHGVSVVAWPSLQKFRGAITSMPAIAKEVGAGRVLLIAVRVEAAGARLTAFFVDPATERKLGVVDLERRDVSNAAQREILARELAAAVAAKR